MPMAKRIMANHTPRRVVGDVLESLTTMEAAGWGLSGSHLISTQGGVGTDRLDQVGHQASPSPAVNGAVIQIDPGFIETIGPELTAQI